MVDSGLITIAKKEFFDHVRSRKFLLIFGIFLVVAIIGMIGGVAEYNDTVKMYNDKQAVTISTSDSAIQTTSYLAKPSILLVFYHMSTPFMMIGVILGIAMGFDLISKERESKSLKVLLAHPVYRDEVINGKALGGIAALLLALGIVFVLSVATLLISGLVPDGTEVLLILIFCAISFLFIFTFFPIALCMSAITEDSGKALIYTLIIYTILVGFIPILMSTPAISESVLGPAPEMPKLVSDQMNQATVADSSSGMSSGASAELIRYQQQVKEYSDRQTAFTQTLSLFSPTGNYQKLTVSLTNPTVASAMYGSAMGEAAGTGDRGVDIPGLLSMLSINILALALIPAIFFGIAYVRFMRMDIR